MSDIAAYTTVEHDGFTVETNSGDAVAVRTAMGVEAPADEKVETPVTTEGAEPKADAKPDEPAKSKDSVQSRIDKAIAKQREAERLAKAADDRAAAAERRAQELEATRQARVEPPTERREPAKPEADTFAFPAFDEWSAKRPDGSYEEYISAKVRAEIKHERQQEERQQQERAQWDEHNTLVLAHRTREIEARRLYPEYDNLVKAGTEAMAAAGFTHLPPALGKAILSSERSADIVRDLAAHPADAIQLAKEVADLPVGAAPMVRRLLEARLTAASSGPVVSAKPVTSAKPLIKPVSGTPDATEPDDAAGSDDEPFEKHFERENRRDTKTGRFR